ncbi:sulfatase family protein [Sunxiuqinia sp. A32]|uniref:sulfatase family protein n=1 Tax=Sunxiuqinia sp. A32 TaxID=3461496 RepID=UPI0040455071
MTKFINTVCLLSIIFLISCGSNKEQVNSKEKPNIIFVYTDDQAAWDIGVSGNPQIHTPNMDKLASEGAYFRNSFVTTPVCSPARASLMTSQYASEYDILDFIPQPGHRLYDPDHEIGLDPSSITFAEVLQQNGYKTGLVGKWHLGDWLNDDTKKFHPTNNGYDYFMGITGGGTSSKNPTLEKDGVVGKIEGFTSDILTENALNFINENKDSTFLLCVHYRAPHGPWLPVPEDTWAPYESLDPEIPNPDYPDLDITKVKNHMKEYMASTSGVDENLGKIMSLVEDLGLADNTIFIYSSDHGYNMGHNGIEHKGNGFWVTKTVHPAHGNIAENSRPNLYDNSLKVPAIIKWPGVVKPGTVIEKVMTSLDWYPTVVAMAGADLPEGKIVRGRSLLPLLKGEIPGDWNDDVYSEYSQINYSKAYMRTYRTSEWKLVRDFLNEGRDELYHISVDPEESTNLINEDTAEIKEVIQELDAKIIEKMTEIGDLLLEQVKSK